MRLGSRRQIGVGIDESRINDQAIAALAEHGSVYQRAGELVRVIQYEEEGRLVPRIEALPDASLRELLTDVAEFVGDRGHVHPPDWCVRAVASRGRWSDMPMLRSTVEYPVLRRDGTVLQIPGHDPVTELLYAPSGEFRPVPEVPTHDQAVDARDRLLDLVCDFPFAQLVHRSAWLAGLLTLFARHAYDGPTPFFLVDGNVRGSGKSLLVDVAALVATGRRAPRTTQVVDENEERKRITAVARAGDSLMLVDNIARPFGNGAFDSALTSTTWKERLLGESKIKSFPLSTVWWGTGNNVQFRSGADTARRTLHIRLLSPEQNPEARTDFRYPDLVGHVLRNRSWLAADALTLLRAYRVHGEAEGLKLRSWGSFEGWSELVRTAVVWAGLEDPIQAHEQLAQLADITATALQDLVAGWEHMCKEQNVTGCTTRQAIEWLAEDLECKARLSGHQLRFARLLDALGELCVTNGRPLPDARQLGYALRSYRGRVVDGKYLETDGQRQEKGQQWTVKQR